MKKVKKPVKSKKLCRGCLCDFYNRSNNLDVSECWCFPSAMVEKKLLISIDALPPYLLDPSWVLDCYRKSRIASINPKVIGKDGYWIT